MNFRDRPRRPFSLATELRVMAAGLFAVAGGALLLSRSEPVVPSEVAGAALVVLAVTVLNVAVGLRRARRAADAVER
ncbi:hypothetical protein Caci_8065 [Catenulispora acidiphila DSM 44928]|uniref:Uncharacterized protein n=1 Tax=Catenulispora acidiphila (strain DSM 44928 / JCM 14897 / NBRC 102108 / NRRL B-24433 / ID139908) TaxID=479433 RepID=C7QH38_CATAD|nr:hypothetical protein [Catenulispora acidiphila]ACU76888.1 hypothetical protein Caci_8065 [Catenulispora acidiphila DSM 44928]